MKLHLPKLLLTAVLATCSMATAMTKPVAGDNSFTWNGVNWVNANGDTVDKPSRSASGAGAFMIMNEDLTTNPQPGDTSDKGGGIMVADGVHVSDMSLGTWGGTINVGAGAYLDAWVGQIKSENAAGSSDVANVWVDGQLNLRGFYKFDGQNAPQNWHIGENGYISLADTTSIDGNQAWNIELVHTPTEEAEITGLTNRERQADAELTRIYLSAEGDLSNKGHTLKVVNAQGEELSAETGYKITENSFGFGIKYTGLGYQRITLTWAGDSDDAWVEKGASWTDTAGIATSFLNGDSVIFDTIREGISATIAIGEDVTANAITVNDNYTFVAKDNNVLSAATITIADGKELSVSGNLTLARAATTGTIRIKDGTLTLANSFKTTGSMYLDEGATVLITSSDAASLLENAIYGAVGSTVAINKSGNTFIDVNVTNFTGSLDVQAGRVIVGGRNTNGGGANKTFNATRVIIRDGGEFTTNFGQNSKKITTAFDLMHGAKLSNVDGNVEFAGTIRANINDPSASTPSYNGNGSVYIDPYWGKKLNFTGLIEGEGTIVLHNTRKDQNDLGSGDIHAKYFLDPSQGENTFNGTYKLADSNSVNQNDTIQLYLMNKNAAKYASINLASSIATSKLILGASASIVNLNGSNATKHIVTTDSGVSATLTLQGGNFGGVLQDGDNGALSITKTGSGQLALTAANTYSGGTTVQAGTLLVKTSAALGSGAVEVQNGATLDVDIAASGSISGEVTLKSGSTMIVRNGYADFDTPPELTAAIKLDGDATLESGWGGEVGKISGTLNGQGTLSLLQPRWGEAYSENTWELASALSDKSDTEKLTLNSNANVTISNANSYSGGTTITGRTLTAANESALGTGKVTMNGGTLAQSAALSVSSMEYNGGTVDQGDYALTVTGKLDVKNNMTIGHAANEEAGTAASTGAISIGSLDLAADTTLTTYGNLEVAEGGTIKFGNGSTMSVNGSLTLDASAVQLGFDIGDLTSVVTKVELATATGGINLTGSWSGAGEYVIAGEKYIADLAAVDNVLSLTFDKVLPDTPSITSQDTSVTSVVGYDKASDMLTLQVEHMITSDTMVSLTLITDEVLADIQAALNGADDMFGITLQYLEGNTLLGQVVANDTGNVAFYNEKGQGYWGVKGADGSVKYKLDRIPEPTTTTLSLLALCGLAARRRRK